MKRILLLLLLASPAFGQAYSQMAIQNTTGNWLKAAPGASVFLCTVVTVSSDCLNGLNKVPLYTDQTLTTGTSNPITADVNGNYTLFATPGLYLQCVQAVTSFCQVIQIGGNGGTIGNCGTSTSVAYYPLANASINCDQFFTDNGSGNPTAKSLGLTDNTKAGFAYFGQGTQPTLSAANSAYQFAPATITSSLGFKWLGSLPTNGDCAQFGVTGSVWTLTDAGNPCGTGSGFPGQGTLNNPSTPTVTPTGTTGAASYTYGIVGCEDASCVYHSAIVTGSTSSGNATLSSSNYNALTAYGDTLYGYRGYIICRTAGGSSQGRITGVVTLQAGKKFNDTGLSGDSNACLTTYASNTTLTYPFCLGAALPGYPSVPGAPCGVDGPPLSPNALDDEMTQTFGAPADVNDPFWAWVNQGSATAAWSSGTIILTGDTTASLNMEMLEDALPSAPYTYITYVDLLPAGSSTPICVLGFRESSTSKMATALIYSNVGRDTTTDSFIVGAYNWTNNTTNSAVHYYPSAGNAFYLKIQNDGSGNLNFWYSPSGDGINYIKIATETVATAFTTAPNQLVIGVGSTATVAPSCTYDYVRRTQ